VRLLTALFVQTTLTPVHANKFAMSNNLPTISLTTLQHMLSLFLFLVACSVSAQTTGRVPVNIFGDGNPDNGVEDNREQVMGGRGSGVNLADQRVNAGTIKCDGKIRGTAMVIDTRDYAPGLKGVVLASAAHVLYNLDTNKRYKRCEFHFLALGELARYRSKLDLKTVREGGFDPGKATGAPEFGEGDWAFLYVPKPWSNFNPDESLNLRNFSHLQMESFQQSGGELRLVAFDSSAGVMSVSKNCTVIESGADDLGGGSWKGQLLDDCDSTGGASGGGIIAVLDHMQYLIGIRSGSHWNEEVYPAAEYPAGPPDGSVWDRHSNTNFGRAIDAHLIEELLEFVQNLVKKSKNI